MEFESKSLFNDELLDLYINLLKPRLVEEKMLNWLRQGGISKWFSGIGQEAISVGLTKALRKTDFIFPLHRNLGVFTSRGIDLGKLFAQFQGKTEGFTSGRDRSFHFVSEEHRIFGMISHLGAQLAVADGVALANLLLENQDIVVAFSGDGGASEGDFHEALNVAAVWNLPVIFLIENNGWGLSTPTNEQYKFTDFTAKGPAYGIDAYKIDGNNVLEVYNTVTEIANKMRINPAPVILEAVTFRMRGHEEASGTKYVPQELFDLWATRDPVENFEKFLLEAEILDTLQIDLIRKKIKLEIEEAIEWASALPFPVFNSAVELNDMYMKVEYENTSIPKGKSTEKRFIDTIRDTLQDNLDRFPDLILMGQDIATYGGVFKATEGLYKTYGEKRIRNTPLCESAILGMGLGLSVHYYKSVIEMQFADFVTCGFNQIVNNLAKSHYRTGLSADVVIRMPTGAGVSAGPFHSQSNESWFFHTPGLKIVYPSSPHDAKGLLNAAIADSNPVLFFEHKQMYRSVTGLVPDEYYQIPIGKSNIVKEGEDITVITYGIGVRYMIDIQQELSLIDLHIIDLRTLLPWDREGVLEGVKKTGKVFLLSEDTLTGSILSELSAWIAENAFFYLDAPIIREASLDTPVPFSPNLEKGFLPYNRIKSRIEELYNF